jgi:hypothetical protein
MAIMSIPGLGPWRVVAAGATAVAISAGVLAYHATLAEPYEHGKETIGDVLNRCRAHMDEGCADTRAIIYYSPISNHVVEAVAGSLVASALIGSVWVLRRRRSPRLEAD